MPTWRRQVRTGRELPVPQSPDLLEKFEPSFHVTLRVLAPGFAILAVPGRHRPAATPAGFTERETEKDKRNFSFRVVPDRVIDSENLANSRDSVAQNSVNRRAIYAAGQRFRSSETLASGRTMTREERRAARQLDKKR